MATNLRLRPDAEDAVRREAERTGRSQQEVIRDAIDRQLGLSTTDEETNSDALHAELERRVADDDVLVASSLAWVEVSRSIRSLAGRTGYGDEHLVEAIDAALSGIAERPLTDDVIGLARRVAPPVLRTLDANPPPGCNFAGRCRFVFQDCETVDPGLVEVAPAHEAACLLYADRVPAAS